MYALHCISRCDQSMAALAWWLWGSYPAAPFSAHVRGAFHHPLLPLVLDNVLEGWVLFME